MIPNEIQLRHLAQTLENKDKPSSLARELLSWRFYVLFLPLFGGGAIYLWDERPRFAAFFGGVVAGVVWMDVANARFIQRFKAIANHVTDWEKVKRLLDDPGKDIPDA